MQPQLVMFTVVGVSFSDPAVAFDIVVPRDDTTLFHGYAAVLPAVTSLTNHGPAYSAVGDTRTVGLSDGGSFREQIVRTERPSDPVGSTGHFDYDVTEFTGILSRIVSGGEARWSYAPGTTGRTRITWSYGYRPLPGRTFLVRHMIGPLWIRYMRRSMGTILKVIVDERGAGPGA